MLSPSLSLFPLLPSFNLSSFSLSLSLLPHFFFFSFTLNRLFFFSFMYTHPFVTLPCSSSPLLNFLFPPFPPSLFIFFPVHFNLLSVSFLGLSCSLLVSLHPCFLSFFPLNLLSYPLTLCHVPSHRITVQLSNAPFQRPRCSA